MVPIAGTPWAREHLTPQAAAAIRAIVPGRRVRKIALAACRRPGDWSAYLIRPGRPADAIGAARHRPTLEAAVAAAVHDMEQGPPLSWCSHCSKPARFQRAGEAYCAVHERRGAI